MHEADAHLLNAERCERFARSCTLDQERARFSRMAEECRQLAREARRPKPEAEASSFAPRR